MSKMKQCPGCNGTGFRLPVAGVMKTPENQCKQCGGSGQVPDNSPPYEGTTCLPGDSKVLAATGWSRIDEICPGDSVISVNSQGVTQSNSVLRKRSHRPCRVMKVTTDTGMFQATRSHSISTPSGWLRVGALKKGSKLLRYSPSSGSGIQTVLAIEEIEELVPVFNLIVARDYTFVFDGCVAHSFSYFRTVRMVFSEIMRLGNPLFHTTLFPSATKQAC